MGITRETFEYILKFLPEGTKTLCELGDQTFQVCPPFKDFTHTKEFWEEQGIFYLSIDINNKGGSIPMDLNTEIPVLHQFDAITNIGTSEHVTNLYSCFKNIHRLTKEKGRMFHVIPAPNNWVGHGLHYLGEDFFIELAQECNYKIIDLHSKKCFFGGEDSVQTHCVMDKLKEESFIDKKIFYQFPIHKS